MRLKQMIFIFSLMFALGVGIDSALAQAADEKAARIVTLRGQVALIRPDGNRIALRVGDAVYKKDRLKVGKNSALKLLFSDRTIVDLGADSELKINEFLLKNTKDRKVDIELSSGKMRASVNEPVTDQGEFKVKTKSVVMGVRGTEFVVESMESSGVSGAGGAQITVLEGNVSVGAVQGAVSLSGNSISLSAGQQLNSSSVAAPVQNLSSNQTFQVSQSSTVNDQSFQATVNMDAPAASDRSNSVSSSRTPAAAVAAVVKTVSQAVVAAPPRPMNLGQMRLPGTAADSQSVSHPPQTTNLLVGAPATLKVIFNP